MVHSWVTSTLIREWLDYSKLYIFKNIPVLSIETYNCSKFASWLVFAPVILKKDLNICKVTTIRTYIFQKITPIILFEPIFIFYLHQVLYSHHYKSKLCKVTSIQTYILQTITSCFLLEPIYFFYLHHVLYSLLFFLNEIWRFAWWLLFEPIFFKR